MKRVFYRIYFKADDGAGAGDSEMVSFGEAFGMNPDGTPYEADPEVTPDPDPPAPPQENEAEAGGEAPPATPQPGETQKEADERVYAGKYKTVDDLEKGYGEADAFIQRLLAERQQQAKAEPEAPPAPPEPTRLLKGEGGEIKTEAQLYQAAQDDPAYAADWAMKNSEKLSDEQFETVMNVWIANQPLRAISAINEWNAQKMRDEWDERQANQDQHYMNQVADTGIDQAIKEMPLMAEYQHELGEYIEQNPHLEQMVAGARNADELKNSLQAIFYMMAGPRLAQTALEAQVAGRVNAEAAAAAAAEAEAAASAAGSIGRSNAVPPGAEDDYDEAMRQKILNPRGVRG